MILTLHFIFTFIFPILLTNPHPVAQRDVSARLDSLVKAPTDHPFNGVIVVSQAGKTSYSVASGFSDAGQHKPLKPDAQFILASLSKQITAVLVLREADAGRLKLHDPIRKYLPDLDMTWTDSVTVHHLLNHTSGITATDQPLAFRPGSQFSYSGFLGYQLLGKIIEKTSGRSYSELAKKLFRQCGMKNTTTAVLYESGKLVNSYLAKKGRLEKTNIKLSDLESVVPGAAIISTAEDLVTWNDCLHTGELLNAETYTLMTTPSATRSHPVWGEVGYGYGLQLDRSGGVLEIGHSGSLHHFNSANFYYPATSTSVIVLSNTNWYEDDIQKSFFFHQQVQRMVRESLSGSGNNQ